jgi:hypothetical protein
LGLLALSRCKKDLGKRLTAASDLGNQKLSLVRSPGFVPGFIVSATLDREALHDF